ARILGPRVRLKFVGTRAEACPYWRVERRGTLRAHALPEFDPKRSERCSAAVLTLPLPVSGSSPESMDDCVDLPHVDNSDRAGIGMFPCQWFILGSRSGPFCL